MLENLTEYCSSASLMYCILSGGVSFAVWKYFLGKYDKGELPTLTYQESELSQYLIKNCKELTKPFKPPFYARYRTNVLLSTKFVNTIEKDYVIRP